MNEAIIVFSRSGLFTTPIKARDIRSHEHARKLWPLVTPSAPYKLMTWVRASLKDGKRLRRSHFRILTGVKKLGAAQIFEKEETERYRVSRESPEHLQAKQMVAQALQRRLENGRAMPWYFKDETSSQFHFEGNLLLGAENIHIEKQIKTSFGCEYRLDVAITSKPIYKDPIILGGIEIEWGHQFDGRKALLGKTQAFPLISIDITGMSLEEITPKWADKALTTTTYSSELGQRKTYIYIHDVLLPLYVKLPSGLVNENKHQFLVFASDKEISRLEQLAKKLQALVGLKSNQMSVSSINAKSEQSNKVLQNAGLVVGHDWHQINSRRCLMLTIQRPSPFDLPSHLFHLCMANLFLSHTDSLVGYKYKTGIQNENPEEDIWLHPKWNREKAHFEYSRILPKRLAEPRSRIIDVLNSLGEQINVSKHP